MSVMSTEVIPGGWRYADLEQLPDDGHRYEIIDGTLLVNAAPSYDHQGVVGSLLLALRLAAPPEFRVLTAPFDVVLADDTVVEPDLVVGRREAFGAKNIPGPPDLVIEVLSPSTRRVGLSMKKERFERAGIPAYWVVTPTDPRVQVFELRDGVYVDVAEVEGDEPFSATIPFEVTVVPSELPY